MNSRRDRYPELPLLRSEQQENELLADFIRRQSKHGGTLNILEAGCGNSWAIRLDDVCYRLTGVDLDPAALDLRKNEQRDLDEAILGDLHSVALEENTYDVIYNSFVLEHVHDAQRLLDNFWRWLKPGGILILRMPDGRSVSGYMTRILPFRAHVWFKRYVERMPNAGHAGFAPYPTVFDPIVSRRGIRRWCAEREAVLLGEYGARYYFDHLGIFTRPIRTFLRAVHLLSFGTLACDHNNLTYVIGKPNAAMASDELPLEPAELAV
jgi:SAM-dependent methyltransferase